MSKKIVVVVLVTLALALYGFVTVPPERSVETYKTELHAADAAIKDAKERGADKQCPARYMDAALTRHRAVDVFWSCRTEEAIKMLREATAKAEKLCGVMDSDGDGVTDDKDECPGTPKGAKVDMRGCWVLKNLHFELDKSDIKPESYPILDEAVKVLKDNPDLNVVIEGHTDSQGSAEYNQTLSEARANSVKEYLISKGINKRRLSTVGYGLTRPIDTNETAAGRANNRRVELKPTR